MTRSHLAWLLVWLLNAVGAAAFAAGGGEPGVRHVLKSSQDRSVYCSLLAPQGWPLEVSDGADSDRDRFMFHPPGVNYPYLMVDAWRAGSGEVAQKLERAKQLPGHALLEDDAPSQCFDADRSAVWQISKSDRTETIRVQLIREPMLILQFVGAVQVDPAEPQTMVKVVDTIDFEASAADEAAVQTRPATAAAAVQPKFLLQTEGEGSPGRKYALAVLAACVVLVLVVVERTMRRRADEQRIRETEEAIEARKAKEVEDYQLRPRRKPKRQRT